MTLPSQQPIHVRGRLSCKHCQRGSMVTVRPLPRWCSIHSDNCAVCRHCGSHADLRSVHVWRRVAPVSP